MGRRLRSKLYRVTLHVHALLCVGGTPVPPRPLAPQGRSP
ncbi:hypothetical protein HMPREF1316_1411 [Olsenella profusa F0195]|uniref:Uncharacterized protein n=1 Tax=Olsenella profusa F0195 TaxID=1125712 RepID=U2TUK4_9ACTN|nr:hypothetical protein HMPREF1316_1411 [Olsenella profusa F0195]